MWEINMSVFPIKCLFMISNWFLKSFITNEKIYLEQKNVFDKKFYPRLV